MFYNSSYSFSHRLYASLDVDLPHIHLYQPLSELTQQSLLYVKDSLSQKIFRYTAPVTLQQLKSILSHNNILQVCKNNYYLYIHNNARTHTPRRSLICLNSLSIVDEMSELFRNDLLPSADEVAALSLQFAQPPMADSADINDLGEQNARESWFVCAYYNN